MNQLARVVLGLGLLALGSLPLLADESPKKESTRGLEGYWEGSLKVSVAELRLVFHVTKKPDGTLAGTFDSPDQGAKGIPFDEVSLKDNAVRFEFKAGKASYEGTLGKEGSEITGQWKQGGQSFPLALKRSDKPPVVRRPQEPKKPYPYKEEEVDYKNKEAGVKLAGTLTLPRGQGPFPAVLLITGSGPQDRDETIFGHKPFLVLADYLTRRGIAVLRADDRGVGKSTGDHNKATTADFAGDVRAGLAFLKGRPDINPKQIGLIGHSEGGVIAPLVAADAPDVAFIVMLAGTGLPGDQILYLQGQAVLKATGAKPDVLARQRAVQELMFNVMRQEKDDAVAEKKIRQGLEELYAKLSEDEKKEAEKTKGAMDGQIKRLLSPWFRYFLAYDPRPTLGKVHCPVLVLNGEKDVQVLPKENTDAIEKALKAGGNTDYAIKVFPSLNHLFQTCKTGAVSEYGTIEETVAPVALEAVGDWILKHTTGKGVGPKD
jgi:pimeloyl-ACP methyl ester carboxylesterase